MGRKGGRTALWGFETLIPLVLFKPFDIHLGDMLSWEKIQSRKHCFSMETIMLEPLQFAQHTRAVCYGGRGGSDLKSTVVSLERRCLLIHKF